MFRSFRFVMAALIFVGSLIGAARPGSCFDAEPSDEVPVSLGSMDAEGTLAESELLWPHTWEPTPGLTVRLRGRIDTDAIWSNQSPANEATFGDLGDVVGLRR